MSIDTNVDSCATFVTPTGSNRIGVAMTQGESVTVTIFNTASEPFVAVDSRFNLSVQC